MESRSVISTMSPRKICLIEPTKFRVSDHSLQDNVYMQAPTKVQEDEINNKVIREARNLKEKLEEIGVDVVTYKQRHNEAFDSIFACDWFATIKNEDFPEGIFFVFPMKWPHRRLERNTDLIREISQDYKYIVDLTYFEEEDKAFESFGAMSIDFYNRKVYVNPSERAHVDVIKEFVDKLNEYSIVNKYSYTLIDSADPKNGLPCFHTGLYFAFCDITAFISREYFKNPDEYDQIIKELNEAEYKYDIIELTDKEVMGMCANVYDISVKGSDKKGLVMSKMSYENFSSVNLQKLEEKYTFIVVDMDTINTYAGGSLRCMSNMIY